MSHQQRRALADKQMALNKFNNHMKARVKSSNSDLSAPLRHSSVFSNNKADKHFSVPQKTKRLKTVKQRNQIREQSNNRSNQSHPQCKRGSIDKQQGIESQDSQCGRLLTFSRKVPFPSQKPSIITEGRLTSIRGLFSHEVRSVDIERLVKQKKHQKHTEKQEGQATASNSSSPSGVISHSTPPAVISETSEEGISAHANAGQQQKQKEKAESRNLEKAEQVQMNLEGTAPVVVKHRSGQTHKAINNTAISGSPSDHTGIQEAVILSESEPVHKSFPTSVKNICLIDHYVSPNTKNTHDQKQTNKTPVAVDVQHDPISAERLDSLGESEILHSNAQLFEPSPVKCKLFLSTLDRESCSLGNEEAVTRLAARLCRNLVSFPPQPCCHLLTKCKQVLLHQLKERHGSRLKHNLHRLRPYLITEAPRSPHTADQAWPSSVQQCLDSPQMYFNSTGEFEDHEPRETMDFQQDTSSQKQFCKNVEQGADSKGQSRQSLGISSPEDYVTTLHQPGQDTLSQWSKGTQHTSKSQSFFPHQAFTWPHTSTLWPNNCTEQLLNPLFLKPKKQVKLGSNESRGRHSTTLPLLEKWRNDPDLNFLFQSENSKRSHTSVGTHTSVTELRARSPQHYNRSVSERPLFSAASAVSPFFPPEGFCYEPYYRFTHPSNSFSRSEKSVKALYIQPDVDKRDLCPSLHLTTSYFSRSLADCYK